MKKKLAIPIMLSFLSFLAITNGLNTNCDFVQKGTVCPLMVENVIAIGLYIKSIYFHNAGPKMSW